MMQQKIYFKIICNNLKFKNAQNANLASKNYQDATISPANNVNTNFVGFVYGPILQTIFIN